jgi:hypothetical protein
MDSVQDHPKVGFPHSEIFGSKPVRGSPKLIAAYHVLHRLLAPRHPPNALLALDQLLISQRTIGPGDLGSPSRAGGIPRPRNSILTREAVPPGNTHRVPPNADLDVKTYASSQRCHRTTHEAGLVHAPNLGFLYGNRSHQNLVEVNGIEPMTSCLQSRRSPN